MKSKLFSILLLCLFLFACNSSNTENHNSKQTNVITQDDINIVMDNWLKLWESNDLNLIDSVFFESKELTYFSSEKEGLISGFDALKPHHTGFGFVEGGKQNEKSLWLEDLESHIYGQTALVAGIWYFGDRSDTTTVPDRGPVSFILIKNQENKTKIIHCHFANY